MTPAEREALRKYAEKATPGPWMQCIHYVTDAKANFLQHGHDGEMYEQDASYIAAASPDVILNLLDLISTLELTLSNATKVGVVQIERISELEHVMREYRKYCTCPYDNCPRCAKTDALLAPPPEPIPEEKR